MLVKRGIQGKITVRIKNDFQLICNNLNQCKKECYCNPIVCSRAFLRSYVKNDLDYGL